MTGIEAVVEYLRERERSSLWDFRHAVSNARQWRGSWSPVVNPALRAVANDVRRIRAILASLRDVERRARIDELRELVSTAKAASLPWHVAQWIEERIAELESEQPPTREGDER